MNKYKGNSHRNQINYYSVLIVIVWVVRPIRSRSLIGSGQTWTCIFQYKNYTICLWYISIRTVLQLWNTTIYY